MGRVSVECYKHNHSSQEVAFLQIILKGFFIDKSTGLSQYPAHIRTLRPSHIFSTKVVLEIFDHYENCDNFHAFYASREKFEQRPL